MLSFTAFISMSGNLSDLPTTYFPISDPGVTGPGATCQNIVFYTCSNSSNYDNDVRVVVNSGNNLSVRPPQFKWDINSESDISRMFFCIESKRIGSVA